jgi:4a-hydroxytetrahydrobiopterin dehydratase
MDGGSLKSVTLLDAQEVQQLLGQVEGWSREGESIVKERTLADFSAAMDFVNRVAELAQEANHHPDILLHGWNKVRLTLSTHSDGGLTSADFELAGQIDGLA